ncbi:MAG: hypothetical protein GYB53_22620 [Rhodobacteraceae bacterium]|nr:hypothetical protein [Paracoccaceae bacterium]
MSFQDDPRLAEAKTLPIEGVIERLGIAGLVRTGSEFIGPCPLCGGRDRFGINRRSLLFQCRQCGMKGGDQVALVREVMGLSFPDALGWLCGDRPAAVDPKEFERRQAAARRAEQKRREDAEKYRRKAINHARQTWAQAERFRGSEEAQQLLRGYLASRGLGPERLAGLPDTLLCIPDHPYVRKIAGENITLHRGPCMIAAAPSMRDQLDAVHQTWFSAEPPHRKVKIVHEGKDFPAKMVRGSLKGGAIRLHKPEGADTLIMGEGIETTLSAMVANVLPRAAFWAGVSLGNMSGQMQKVQGTRHSGLPDMTDTEAFLPPPWVRRLIFIQDGDSDPKATRAKLESGLRRAMAMRPGLKAQIVHAGEGVDLNDVLCRDPKEEN